MGAKLNKIETDRIALKHHPHRDTVVLQWASGSIVYRTANASTSGDSLWGSSAQLVHAMRQAYTTSPKGNGSTRECIGQPDLSPAPRMLHMLPSLVLKTQFMYLVAFEST